MVAPRGKLASALALQTTANRSGISHDRHFAGHRARLTQEVIARAPANGSGRLCLLGIGNANDVELDQLASRFAEVHLVDIDAEAVARVRGRITGDLLSRVITHAPVDVSGLFDRVEGWAAAPPEVEALADAVEAGVAALEERLPGPFDVVVSCCLLTQLQLVLLQVVGPENPRFEEMRTAINHVHVLSLASLLAAGGSALLVTDLTSSNNYPLDSLPPETDLAALMSDLVHAGNVIRAAHPGLLSAIIRRDAELKALFGVRFPVGPWLWHNGPDETFLVYALEIKRSP